MLHLAICIPYSQLCKGAPSTSCASLGSQTYHSELFCCYVLYCVYVWFGLNKLWTLNFDKTYLHYSSQEKKMQQKVIWYKHLQSFIIKSLDWFYSIKIHSLLDGTLHIWPVFYIFIQWTLVIKNTDITKSWYNKVIFLVPNFFVFYCFCNPDITK